MKSNQAFTNTLLSSMVFDMLTNVHLKINVKFTALADQFIQILKRHDVVDRRADAGAQKAILHALADHDVVAAHAAKEKKTSGDLAISKQRRARHGVVPIAITAGEWQHGGEAIFAGAPQRDAAAKCEGQPDQAAHFLPKPIARAQSTDERLAALAEILFCRFHSC